MPIPPIAPIPGTIPGTIPGLIPGAGFAGAMIRTLPPTPPPGPLLPKPPCVPFVSVACTPHHIMSNCSPLLFIQFTPSQFRLNCIRSLEVGVEQGYLLLKHSMADHKRTGLHRWAAGS